MQCKCVTSIVISSKADFRLNGSGGIKNTMDEWYGIAQYVDYSPWRYFVIFQQFIPLYDKSEEKPCKSTIKHLWPSIRVESAKYWVAHT